MDKKVWFAVHVSASPDAAEAIEFTFNSLEALGIEIIDLPKAVRDVVTVTGYFDLLPSERSIRNELEDALKIHGLSNSKIVSITTEVIENADWLAEWKKYWEPTCVGRFVIAAPWHEVDEPAKVVIRIEPSMAFGTGTHETTRLCLSAIEKDLGIGESFLDVGTGTGILAIAAAKKSASSAANFLAIDTDPDSITIARENAELNGVGDRIKFDISELSEKTPGFDFVCANLTLEVILPILPRLLKKSGRVLVLSGILGEQVGRVVDGIGKCGFAEPEISSAGEWAAITIRKN